jgi:hypothetical protein
MQSITIAEARAGDIPTERRDVCFTPRADMCGATSDVRHGPEADIHSIISSARESKLGGTVRAIAFGGVQIHYGLILCPPSALARASWPASRP